LNSPRIIPTPHCQQTLVLRVFGIRNSKVVASYAEFPAPHIECIAGGYIGNGAIGEGSGERGDTGASLSGLGSVGVK
jgi:hypothetical protein